MDKVKHIDLTETAAIKAEANYTIELVKKIDQGQRRPTETLKNEVENLNRGMIDAPYIDKC